MNDEYSVVDGAPENVAITDAMTKLDDLDTEPLEQHPAIYEDVRSCLHSALDAD